MSLSMLLQLAWRQSIIRLTLFFAIALALGLLVGEPAWALGLACAVLAARAYWRLYRVLRFLDWRKQLRTVDGQGLWAALETLIHRRQTENRRRTRRLIRLLRGYRQAATAMPDGALIVQRRDGHLVWFNKTARQLLGLRYPASLGDAFGDLFADQPRVRDWLMSPTAEESLADVGAPGDGSLRLSLRRIDYSPTQWLLVVRDVTKLMRLEHVRRDFVANVSHELKTPLTVVAGFAETLAEDEHLTPEQRQQFAQAVLANASRMQRIVDDLLDLSRIESGRWRPAPEEVPVAEASAEATAAVQSVAATKGVTLDIAPAPDAAILHADPTAVRQVVSNLVENAVRHTAAGGRVAVTTRRSDDGIWLSVRDTGIGIAPEHLPRVFERFYRVDPGRSREAGGTGLGLAIVRHLVEAHGGRIHAESEVGRGTTIEALFPHVTAD